MRISSYIRIFKVLGDGNWHNCQDWCRPLSEDKRRLREMQENGWIQYEHRITRGMGGSVAYTEYRITKIWDTFWEYHKKYSPTRMVNNQMEMMT